jgi:antitoxin component YwqK of YwqJK toxin-antitoxin module
MPQPFELERGSSKLSGTMNEGALDGPFKVLDAKKPLASMQYKKGELHGPMLMMHPNGKVSAQLHYQAGQLHGPAKFFSSQGALQRECVYQQGQLQGVSIMAKSPSWNTTRQGCCMASSCVITPMGKWLSASSLKTG